MEESKNQNSNKDSSSSSDSSSETSSYKDSDEEKMLGSKIKMAGKDLDLESATSSDEDILDEEEGPIPVSYVKTAHEVNPEEVEKVGPKFDQQKLDELD